MSEELNIGGFVYSRDENGDWTYKANTPNIPRLETKPKYKDAPRYPVIYQYEGKFKQEYEKMTQDMVKELHNKMKQYIK